MKIVVVAGTRPEFIKLAPVVQELRRRGESPMIIATGQHTDLLRGTPFEDGMAPQVNLGLAGSNDPLAYAAVCEGALRARWAYHKPDLVMVQGDTASAYAAARAACGRSTVVHIEAGIRSHDEMDPWPEEAFRTAIDQIAQRLYCATEHAMDNLCVENSIQDRLNAPMPIVTGNPGIDALYNHTKPVEQSQKVDRVLITLHRRECFGLPLREIVSGIHRAARMYPHLEFVWPLHPNPRVAEALEPQIVNSHEMYVHPDNLIIQAAMGTVEFAQMLSTSRAVITDSGGVQEEAAALGIPAVIAREKTDRPESVELGLARVAGRTEAGILAGMEWALEMKIEPSTVFGDGHAAERIVEHLLKP